MKERTFGRATRFQVVRAELESLAHRLGPHGKFPPMREMAERFGAGINTLAGALDDLEAREVVYRRHGVGVFVSPRLGRTVCLVASPDFWSRGHSPFWDVLLGATRERADAGHEKFELHFAGSSENLGEVLQSGLQNRVESGQIHGVIGVGLRDEAVAWIARQNVPFVSLFGPLEGEGNASVNLDIESLIATGTALLHARGCARIECWAAVFHDLDAQTSPNADSSQPHDDAGRAQKRAFLSALAQIGVDAAQAPQRWRSFTPRRAREVLSRPEQGFEVAKTVFSGPKSSWPDGVLSLEDGFTHGVLMALKTLGVEVGRDVQIATHANSKSPVLMGHPEPLWLLEFEVEEIAETVFDALEKRMNGDTNGAQEFAIAPHLRAHLGGG